MAEWVSGDGLKQTFIEGEVPQAPLGIGRHKAASVHEIEEALKKNFSDFILEARLQVGGHALFLLEAVQLHAIVRFLRDEPTLQFTNLEVISSTDFLPTAPISATADKAEQPAKPGRIENLYVLSSYLRKEQVHLKVLLDRDNPIVDSLSGLYRAANWYERECFDLLGVKFRDHPYLKRILLPEDWVGHPLRRDYIFPETYNGMKVPL